MISKTEFVEVINKIKELHDFEEKLDSLLGYVEFPSLETTVVKLLNKEFNIETENEYGGDIAYFIYDLNLGEAWAPGMVLQDDEDIDFSTAEKLYDYLTKEQAD